MNLLYLASQRRFLSQAQALSLADNKNQNDPFLEQSGQGLCIWSRGEKNNNNSGDDDGETGDKGL